MQEATTNARLRVLHTSPDAPALDAYVDGSPVATHLLYGQLSDYVTLSPERHRLQIFPTGTHRPEEELVDTQPEKLKPYTAYTVAAMDNLQDIQAILIEDSTLAPAQGRAKVRVVHASPDAPAVDIGVSGGPTLFDLVSFTEATPYHELDPGVFDLEVRRSHHSEVIARVEDYPISGDHLYTFVALGLVDGEPHFAIVPLAEAVRRCVPVR